MSVKKTLEADARVAGRSVKILGKLGYDVTIGQAKPFVDAGKKCAELGKDIHNKTV